MNNKNIKKIRICIEEYANAGYSRLTTKTLHSPGYMEDEELVLSDKI